MRIKRCGTEKQEALCHGNRTQAGCIGRYCAGAEPKRRHLAVGGSLLLYFKGKTGVFRDIDLMVCETDVEKLKQAMLPLGAPAPSDPNAQYRTRCFLEFTVRGVDVDVMAGFVILENGQEHDCALKPEQVAEHILVRGEDIPLQSLEDWRRYYAWMGRTSKVTMIDGKTMR